MRSSKNRSRSKSNRQRSIGNIINRVFDSSGPEGKVRGTPQQIIDKYLMLARDAQLGNDRVAEQNFLQHAEHYTRMLGEAQAELAREQAMRQPQGGNDRPQQNGGRDRDDDQPSIGGSAFDIEDAGLVETPEMRVQQDQRREPRRDHQQGGNRNDGSRNDGNRNDGSRNDGNRNDGSRNDNNRGEGYRDRNQNRSEAPRPERGPRPQRDEPRNDVEPRQETVASAPAPLQVEDIPLPSFVAEPLRVVEQPAAVEAVSKPKPRRRTKPAAQTDAKPEDNGGSAAAE